MQVIASRRNRQAIYTGDVETDVELVLGFLNTVDVENGTDVLRSAGQWREWVRVRGFRAGPLDEAVRARDALRAAVGDPDAVRGEIAVPAEVALTAVGPVVVAGDAVGAVLAAAARLAVLDQWRRVKICPADDCRWAFFDRSRNRSRTWCSMQVCGNREKARKHRAADA